MAKLIRPSIAPRPEISLTPRPLPKALIETYYQSETDFRKEIEKIEKSPAYQSLVTKGIVRRSAFGGRVPQHRYEEYKDEEMIRFFRRYKITEHADWEADFFHPTALDRRQKLAKKYDVPVGELLAVLRYTSYMNDIGRVAPEASISTREDSADFLRFTASETLFDTAPVAERIKSFVERYRLTQDQFVDCFLAKDRPVEVILERVHCSRQEAEAVKAMVTRVQVLSSLCVDIAPATSKTRNAGEKFGPVAEVHPTPDGIGLTLQFIQGEIYAAKYSFNEEAFRLSPDLDRDEQELISQLKAVNQRKNVLHRLVSFLFRYQYRYLLTGNRLHLLPLTQAAAAKALFEEEATISRLIRDKTLRTGHGVISLKALCHRTASVVKDLILIRERGEIESGARERPFTDRELGQILQEEYGIELSRRSITYHRNRCFKESNFYSRVRNLKGPGSGSESDEAHR